MEASYKLDTVLFIDYLVLILYAVVVFGVVSTGLAFLFNNLRGTVVQMIITFMGAIGGPTTAIFLLGIFFPFTNWIVSEFN